MTNSVPVFKAGLQKCRLAKFSANDMMTFKCIITVHLFTSFQYKSAQKTHKLRCSDHDLHIEIGRHKNLRLDKRLCKHCDSQDVEDKIHFLFRCNKYAQIRDAMMQKFPEIMISPLEKALTNQLVEVMSCRTLPKRNSLIIFLCKAKNPREQNPVEP